MNSKNSPHLNEYSKTMKTMTYEFIGRPKWVRFWSQERPLTKNGIGFIFTRTGPTNWLQYFFSYESASYGTGMLGEFRDKRNKGRQLRAKYESVILEEHQLVHKIFN